MKPKNSVRDLLYGQVLNYKSLVCPGRAFVCQTEFLQEKMKGIKTTANNLSM